jgi:hypothetical protein
MHPGRVHAISNAHHIIFGFVLPLTNNGAGGVFNEHCGFGIVCVCMYYYERHDQLLQSVSIKLIYGLHDRNKKNELKSNQIY